jgi:predicted GIY-YIG superfamily endonuclease
LKKRPISVYLKRQLKGCAQAYTAQKRRIAYRLRTQDGAIAPHPEDMYYVYILENKEAESDFIYTGYTNGLKRRLEEHNEGKVESTKHKAPFELVYYEAYKRKVMQKSEKSN